MIISSAQFVTSAVKPVQYPPPDYPELAFSGRSNVGKSSLINTLVNRRHLVKTSRTPGRTQLINFFLINEALLFVDLPGYGYAKVPAAIRRSWGPMIERYVAGRESLRGLVNLLDIRRTPGPEDENLAGWLSARNIPCLWVLTKADKLSKTKQRNRQAAIAREMGIDPESLILFSAKTRQGREILWDRIVDLCGPWGAVEENGDSPLRENLAGGSGNSDHA
jgi:GTP-binding protein